MSGATNGAGARAQRPGRPKYESRPGLRGRVRTGAGPAGGADGVYSGCSACRQHPSPDRYGEPSAGLAMELHRSTGDLGGELELEYPTLLHLKLTRPTQPLPSSRTESIPARGESVEGRLP